MSLVDRHRQQIGRHARLKIGEANELRCLFLSLTVPESSFVLSWTLLSYLWSSSSRSRPSFPISLNLGAVQIGKVGLVRNICVPVFATACSRLSPRLKRCKQVVVYASWDFVFWEHRGDSRGILSIPLSWLVASFLATALADASPSRRKQKRLFPESRLKLLLAQ